MDVAEVVERQVEAQVDLGVGNRKIERVVMVLCLVLSLGRVFSRADGCCSLGCQQKRTMTFGGGGSRLCGQAASWGGCRRRAGVSWLLVTQVRTELGRSGW